MKKATRVLSLTMAAAMAAGMLGGCANGGNVPEKAVKINYVMPGPGSQQDSMDVWNKFNEKLQSDGYNISVNFEVIPLSEYKQKFMLMTSAREQVDIANTYSLDFPSEVRNGTFTALDDLLNEYGKETLTALPEWFMEYQKIGGKTYGIPTYQMCASMRAVVFFKDEAEKYLDIDAFKKALYKTTDLGNKEMYDILEKYMEDLRKAGVKYKDATTLNLKGYDGFTAFYGVKEGEENKVINYALDGDAKLRYEVASDWYKKGYIRQDIISAKDRGNDMGKIGGYAFWDETWTPFVEKSLSEKYDKPVITIPYSEKYYITRTNTAAGTSITEACKNKDKAMQLLNLLQTNKDYYNMLTFGIEGNHYTKTGDDSIKVEYESSPTTNERYGLYKWITGNTELAYNIQTEPDEYKKWVFEEVNDSDYRSPLIGFVPDTSKIQDYITQVSAINGKYYQTLADGALDDWKAGYEQYKAELDMVGNQKIIDELQRQVDEFLKK